METISEVETGHPLSQRAPVALRTRVLGKTSAPARSWAKRAFDVAASVVGLIFLAPAFVAIAIAIKLDSKGPVFYSQRRSGLGGQPFHILKFRSMKVCERGAAIRQAKANDPRITRIGRFLRMTSIDELPQLINVLRGDMSIVGPRPHALVHDEYYGARIESYWQRFATRPGITGLAQVNGLRGETRTIDDMAKRVDQDLRYLRGWHIGQDLTILMRTVAIVMSCKNAY
jgi:putative colanic acid biosysnthesis UDP-glucose lipid carrier transferase